MTTFAMSSGAMTNRGQSPRFHRLCLLILWNRKDRLGGGGVRRQYDGRHEIAVLHAGGADALDLSFRVELDRRSERHLLGDVGLADGFGQRLGIGRFCAPE